MRKKRFFKILAATMLLIAMTATVAAQEDIYVDAPLVPGQPNAGQAGLAGNYPDQFNWGLFNYGFTESIYYQFSGNSIFAGGNSPAGVLNFGWIRIMPLDFQYMPGMAYGAEFINFSSTSEDVYAGDADVVTGPAINMDVYLTNFKIRLFFMDPFEELLHPFFGISWGLILGDFKTTKVGGEKFTTNFVGFSVSRNVGVQVKLGERGGLVTEFRAVTANSVKTSNDPFDQDPGDSVNLDFSGITIALS
ncbi:MAG: hypothetical protein HOE30_18610, partial [Deltaproteobacteria bacterium]|nr:hypothetical protein [Deltaproteobacteria bacterium]